MAKRSENSKRIREEMRKKRVRDNVPKSTPGRRRKGRNRIRNVSIEELRQEYSYVLKDLRRIFILAALMFVLLIAANIIYPLVAG